MQHFNLDFLPFPNIFRSYLNSKFDILLVLEEI